MPGKPAAPESVLKKRKNVEEVTKDRAASAVAKRKARKQSRAVAFKRAEQYVKEYRQVENATIRTRRQAREAGNFYLEPEAKLAFVIRIRGINGISPRTKKILQLLRLRQLNNGVFVRLNGPMLKMLRLVEPYITYGYPNLKTVRELIYKRGAGKVNRQRIPLTSNEIVEENLGSLGLVCVEDVIHEIFTVGPNFKAVNKFLWPFKLNSPKGGWSKIRTNFVEGGTNGNCEHFINGVVRKMN